MDGERLRRRRGHDPSGRVLNNRKERMMNDEMKPGQFWSTLRNSLLPYHVEVVNEQDRGFYDGIRYYQWSVAVYGREYKPLFWTWLYRKPTPAQMAKVACEGFATRGVESFLDGNGFRFYLCDGYLPDGRYPDSFDAYCDRLKALSRWRALYPPFENEYPPHDRNP